MSCWMVSKAHIDALVEAGLWTSAKNRWPLSWSARELTDEDKRECYERSEPWGPRAVELMTELHRELIPETADRVGQMLWRENRLSVDYRYNECEAEPIYSAPVRVGRVNPVVVLKAISCYEYQSCEHPGWETSEGHAFCRALECAMIEALPGYEEAPWGIESRADYRKPA